MAINDFAYEAGGGVAMEAFKYKQVFVKLNQKCSHHQENLGSNANLTNFAGTALSAAEKEDILKVYFK